MPSLRPHLRSVTRRDYVGIVRVREIRTRRMRKSSGRTSPGKIFMLDFGEIIRRDGSYATSGRRIEGDRAIRSALKHASCSVRNERKQNPALPHVSQRISNYFADGGGACCLTAARPGTFCGKKYVLRRTHPRVRDHGHAAELAQSSASGVGSGPQSTEPGSGGGGPPLNKRLNTKIASPMSSPPSSLASAASRHAGGAAIEKR